MRKQHKKKFCEDLQKLFDTPAENAEELMYADRLRTKAAKEEDVAFSCDHKSTRKMQIYHQWITRLNQVMKENIKELNVH